jgi:hypothetical protein
MAGPGIVVVEAMESGSDVPERYVVRAMAVLVVLSAFGLF